MYNELCKILDPGKPSFTLKKGKPSVVMFVGLQGVLIYFSTLGVCSVTSKYVS